jgi:Sulfotransferase family
VKIERMTSPTPLLNGARRPANSFVVPDDKLVYISVTKAACTSLRWMIADLAGEDLASFYPSLEAHQTRLMTVHRKRDLWKHTLQLSHMSDEQIAEISRDDGWFVFAAVRDPWSRLWSAWQSKFLVRHQFYVDRFINEPWFPRVPEKAQDVIDDFHMFVRTRPWETNEILRTDVHFLPQVRSTHPRNVNYTNVYDLHDLSQLFADVHTHLKSLGRDRELYIPRANDTPLQMIPAVLEDGIAENIRDAYAKDFKEYGDRWSVETLRMQDSWTADAIRYAAFHTVANQRLGDMRDEARRLRRRLTTAEARVAQLEALPQIKMRRAAGRVARKIGVRR